MILRRVVDHKYVGACRYTGYANKRIRLTLACGHQTTRKASQGIPAKAFCRECEHQMELKLC